MDFILWPRNDIEKIVCLLFSRWKGADDEPYRPVQVRLVYSFSCRKCSRLRVKQNFIDLQAKFEFHHGDYEEQCLHALSRKDKAGTVMNNPSQSVFLFMDRQHLQVNKSAENHIAGFIHPNPWQCPNVVFLPDSENQGYSFQVVQPLPLPAPGSADLLGCGRHRGSSPSIHAWLRLPAQLSHVGKSLSSPSYWTLQKQSDVFISTCFVA